jgi:hypothetical protein
MKRLLLVVAVALTFTATAAASVKPGDFGLKVMNENLAGQFDRTYDLLYPAQQKFVGKAKFMACYSEKFNAVAGATVSDWKVTDTYSSVVAVPGTRRSVRTTAISVRFTIHLGKQSIPDAATWHLPIVNGHWRWLLDDKTVSQIKTGTCS